jgi:hypothetical protein
MGFLLIVIFQYIFIIDQNKFRLLFSLQGLT